MHDLIAAVPLFASEGHYFRWAHKSLQEYFAAQFICTDTKAKQEAILKAIVQKKGNQRYRPVLELCYDIDYKSFRNTVIRGLIRSFLDYYEGHLVDLPNIPIQDLNFRKLLCFGRELTVNTMQFLPVADTTVQRMQMASPAIRSGWNLSRSSSMNFKKIIVIVHVYEHSIHEVIRVLEKKHDPLLVSPTVIIETLVSKGMAPNLSDIMNWNLILAQSTDVTFDRDSELNSIETFKQTNMLLAILAFGGLNYILDPFECKKMLAEIDADIKRDDESDFLSKI